ncbi:MAG: tetratricopeptide repeat protein, partial [Stackebrandtia sp.]
VPKNVTDTDELSARFRSAVADRRLLLLLDDAADAAQVAPLLPGSPNCAVMVTSRNALTQLDGAAFVRLDVLPRTDALRLFHRLTGHGETGTTAEIVELCGRMPLAICIAAARLNTDPRLPVARLAEQLRSQSHRLGRLDDGQRAVRSTFMVSYQGLNADAATVFRRLGLHEGPDLSVTTAAALAGFPAERAAAVLAELVAAHLIEETEPGRYTLHDLLRLFSRERADAEEPESERREAIERMLHSYLATGRNALLVGNGDGESRCDIEPRQLSHPGIAMADRIEAHAWAKSELANLEAVTRQACATPNPHTAVALAAALFPNLFVLGYWHHAHTMSGIARESAESSASLPHRSHVYRDLAILKVSLGLLDEGLECAELFRDVCVESGDLSGQAMAYHLIGGAYRDMGRLDEAIECLERSLELCGRSNNGQLESLVSINVGMVNIRAGRLDDAARAFRRAAALAEKHGEHQKHAGATCNLGHVQRELGDPAGAMSTFAEARSIIRSCDLAGTMIESDILWGLGDALYDLGRAAEARRHWDESADMLFGLGHITDADRRAIAEADRPVTPRVLR